MTTRFRPLALTTLLAVAAPAAAQDLDLPVLSPRASVSQQVGTVMVTVDYSSPGQRDRDIFGSLVPWGELWRTGANAATTLTVDGDVMVQGEALPAGTYSVFTTPGEESWSLMLNTDAGASTGSYDADNDALTVELSPEEGPGRERLTWLFEDTTDDETTLVLEWAGTRVPVTVAVDSEARGNASIDRFVSRAARGFVLSSRFKSEQGAHDEAVELADKAVAIDESWYTVWGRALALHRAEEHKSAYKAAKQAMELGEAADNFFYEDRVAAALEEWPKR